jgi:23S rRNA pseudouridine1911/1915/1917 synthase
MDATAGITLTVAPEDAGERLDRFCAARVPTLSRNQLQNLNALGGVLVGGRARPDSYAVCAGDVISLEPALLTPPGFEAGWPIAQDIPIPVVHCDDHLVVVNKPPGMVTHPAHGNWDGTVVNALLGAGVTLSGLGGPERPGVVHRLDKDTSGIMVLARTDDAYRVLATALKGGHVSKVYHAIAWGALGTRCQTVDAPVGRHPVKRQQMAVVDSGGKAARTELFVVDSYRHFDYIRVITFTGRTHQIRVHLSHIGHPLLGDSVYGGRRQRVRASSTGSKVVIEKLMKLLPRHALHASRLSFEHPATGRWMSFQTALASDMRAGLETMQREDRTKEVLD